MKNYLCENLNTGDCFIVKAPSIEEAEITLAEQGMNIDEIDFLDVVDDEDAEFSGYKIY